MTVRAHCQVTTFDATTNAVMTSATVNVYTPGTVTPISATIYDRLGNPLSNPLTSDATTGLVDFYLLVAQEVDLVVSKASFTTRTYSNVPVLDDSSLELTALLTTTGDMPYASSANSPARLPVGSNNQVLSVSASAPAWANVSTAMVAANAISQVVATFVNPASAATTTSSSFATISQYDTAITTTGGRCILFASIGFSNNSSAATNNQFGAIIDSGSDLSNFYFGAPASNAGLSLMATYILDLGTPSAGAHTVHIRWATSAGTLSTNTSGAGQVIVVELKK